MFLLYVLALSVIAVGRAQRGPGIVTVLSESLFEQEANIVFTDLEEELTSARYDKITGRKGRLTWELNGINVYHFDGPTTTVEIEGSGNDPVLTFVLEEGTVKASFNWRVSYDAWFKDIQIAGTADARLYGVDMTKSAALGITEEKQLRLESVNCRLSSCCHLDIGDMTITVSGDFVSWIINQVIGWFYSSIEDTIREEACRRIDEIVHTQVNEQLGAIPLRTDIISTDLHLNYSLQTLDRVGDCLVVGVYGAVSPAAGQWTGAQLPDSQCVEDGRHFSTRISGSTIQSLVDAIYNAGQFYSFTVGQDQILKASAIFRPGFFARAKDELMQHYILKMEVNITAAPSTSINTTASCIDVVMPASLHLTLNHPNEHRSNKFLLHVEAELVAGLQLALHQVEEEVLLRGSVAHSRARILNMTLGAEKNISVSSAQSLLDLVSGSLMRPLVTEHLDQGIPTNFGRLFSLGTTVMEYKQNYVEIGGTIDDWRW